MEKDVIPGIGGKQVADVTVETKGIRGVYNKAQYADQRREMLKWWADFVDNQIEENRKVIIGRFGKAYNAN